MEVKKGNFPYLHSSSNELYLLTVLTNIEGGLCRRFPLRLAGQELFGLDWLLVQSKQASMGRLRASPHFHLIMRTPSNRLRRLLNPFPLSTFSDTMGEVSTPQASCTQLPVSTPHRILHTRIYFSFFSLQTFIWGLLPWNKHLVFS